MHRTRVKVCCISSLDEAQMAIDHGVHAIGLVGEMPSGPGVIDDDLAGEIAGQVPPGVETFLLTSRTTAADIADHVELCGTTTVQIVQHIEPAEVAALSERLPRTRRVQVIHVEDETALDLIEPYEPHVHAFLLDSGRPQAAVAEFGGTGRAHDWQISAEFVRRANKPVFLAGGLKPSNVAEAIATVRPFGVDLCSGIRTKKRLDLDLLRQFMEEVWQGASRL